MNIKVYGALEYRIIQKSHPVQRNRTTFDTCVY